MSSKFSDLVNAAFQKAMQLDERVLCYGLGINDVGRIFGTTKGLVEEFGNDRVFDMPTAENGMTGIGLGLAINGFRPVLSHCRLDFSLLSLDQIINTAAKWHSLFAGTMSMPFTMRAIIGRGWGQGPTHCQSLQSCFAQIPGLKIVMPSLADDVYGLLLSSIFDDSPVIFLEHRWLHNITVENVDTAYDVVPLGKARHVAEGDEVTIVSMSYMTIEALHAVRCLADQGVRCDLIDLRTVKPLDWKAVFDSVRKTGRLLVLDTGFEFCSIASEIITRVTIDCFSALQSAPMRLTMPDYPTLTSPTLAIPMYKYSHDIVDAVAQLLGRPLSSSELYEERNKFPKDIPGSWFQGPF